ncbi:Clusterin-associated protein 1 -like protein [Takifugu flavidus]|uniref:Clusterin-associated protein 1-like protein n=1 Tax=Takifugu flavidus TaxID=433684 RepID=A0A5C6NFC8_9TELE|nr:Clusterin-associated protein 1 -like protein [Takifugu flavidus]
MLDKAVANKAHIELNTKNVYKADGYAVKEMLKVTSLLYSAMKTTETVLGDRIEEDNVTFKFHVAPQASDLKAAPRMFKDKFRTLCYLEAQLEAFHRLEQGSFESKDGEFDEDEDDDEDDELSRDPNDDSLCGPISRVPGFYVKSDLRHSVKDDSDNDF